jgi:adenylate kinase
VVIILTGQSGLDRKSYLTELEQLTASKGLSFKVFSVGDLMYEVRGGPRRVNVLDLPLGELNALLKAVFERIRREMSAYDSIAISMHATFRWRRGLIGGMDYSLIEPLRPDVYITLIDDVPDVKQRLDAEYPNHQCTYKDAMVWREEEILTTSIIASLGKKPHYVFARKHPVATFYKLLFEPKTPKIYVSFPISAVIKMPEVLKEIKDFKDELVQHFTVFDPYTISEKQLDYFVQAARRAGNGTIEYQMGNKVSNISVADLQPILTDIDDQIIARDLILVDQSDAVVAFYPCLEGGGPVHSAGREREVTHGRDRGKDVYLIWPSQTHEPGPFERDCATQIFRSVSDARDFLLKKYGQ